MWSPLSRSPTRCLYLYFCTPLPHQTCGLYPLTSVIITLSHFHFGKSYTKNFFLFFQFNSLFVFQIFTAVKRTIADKKFKFNISKGCGIQSASTLWMRSVMCCRIWLFDFCAILYFDVHCNAQCNGCSTTVDCLLRQLRALRELRWSCGS